MTPFQSASKAAAKQQANITSEEVAGLSDCENEHDVGIQHIDWIFSGASSFLWMSPNIKGVTDDKTHGSVHIMVSDHFSEEQKGKKGLGLNRKLIYLC